MICWKAMCLLPSKKIPSWSNQQTPPHVFFFEILSLHCYKSVRKKLVCDSLWFECHWFIDILVPKPWIFSPRLGSLQVLSQWLRMASLTPGAFPGGFGDVGLCWRKLTPGEWEDSSERVDRFLDVVLKKQQACNTPHSAWWRISWMIETFDKCLKKERFYNRANIKIG